jgi:ferredoxin
MIVIDKQLCDVCGACVGVCPVDAISITRQEIAVHHDVCVKCLACVNVCPIGALMEEM